MFLKEPMVGVSTGRRAWSKLILYQDLYVELKKYNSERRHSKIDGCHRAF